MDAQTLWIAIGSIIAVFGLEWAVFTYILSARDASQADDKEEFHQSVILVNTKQEEILQGLNEVKLAVELQKEKISAITVCFHDLSDEMSKMFEKQHEEIAELRKVVYVKKNK